MEDELYFEEQSDGTLRVKERMVEKANNDWLNKLKKQYEEAKKLAKLAPAAKSESN